jgi:hypothetical protein
MEASATLEAVPEQDSPQADVKQIEAVRGEVVSDGPATKVLMWHGVDLVLPAELGAAFMFDVSEAQLGDEMAMLRGIYQTVGKEQWAKARKVAVEEHLPADEFHKLVGLILGEYGLGVGEPSASSDSAGDAGV